MTESSALTLKSTSMLRVGMEREGERERGREGGREGERC